MSVAFSSDGRLLVSQDRWGNSITWNVTSGEPVAHGEALPKRADYTPEGLRIVTGGSEIELRDAQDRTLRLLTALPDDGWVGIDADGLT